MFNAFGRAMHSIFRTFYNPKRKFKTRISYAKSFIGQWKFYRRIYPIAFSPNATKGLHEYAELGAGMAQHFFDENIGERENVDYANLEKEFNLSIYAGNFLVGFNGKIDKMHSENGRPVITDYKTGTTRPKIEELRRNMQFPGYSYVGKQLTGEIPRIDVHYPGYRKVMLSKNWKKMEESGDGVPAEVIQLSFSDEDHNTFIDRLNDTGKKRVDILKRAKEEKGLSASYGHHCHHCPYSISGECDAYTGEGKFLYKQFYISMPTMKRIVRERKPPGQRRFSWPRKEVILVGKYDEKRQEGQIALDLAGQG